MAQIDNLLERMKRNHVFRIVLLSGEPMRLHKLNKQADGPTLSKERINSILEEITPFDIETRSEFEFPYDSSHGSFIIKASKTIQEIRVTISVALIASRASASSTHIDPTRQTIKQILESDEIKNLGGRVNASTPLLSQSQIRTLVSVASFILFQDTPDYSSEFAAGAKQFWIDKGVRSGSRSEKLCSRSYNQVAGASIIAIAATGYNITEMTDTDRGAIIKADMPEGLATNDGKIYFKVNQISQMETQMIGITEIKGQVSDFGKGKRALAKIYAQVDILLDTMQA